jgi:hypothetical protein
MDSNQLVEHIRELNKQEALEHDKRRQEALNKIRELRRSIREQAELNHEGH